MRIAILWLISCCTLSGQVSVNGKVVDENGLAVAGARIEVRPAGAAGSLLAVSDSAGAFSVRLDRAAECAVHAERPGFFVFNAQKLELAENSQQLTIVLNHLQEFTDSIDVVYSPPDIDPQQPSERKQLNQMEILDVPYPAAQDVRKALPLLPGVVEDNAGKLHFNGAASNQTSFELNGFNIADPATGQFESRVNIDSVRALEFESGRFGVDKGRGAGGALDIQTAMGDDRWRISGTNFIPGVSTEKGFHLSKWTPRVQFSGPIARGRAWFHNGFDSFYDVDLVYGLPAGQDSSRSLTTSNLSRFQVNLTPANILTGSLLINYINRKRQGLSFLDPAETTVNRGQNLWMGTVKDQIYTGGGTLFEFGFAETRIDIRERPQGDSELQILPWGMRGNYFLDLARHSHRRQFVASMGAPQRHAAGSHQIRAGIDVQDSGFDQSSERHGYRILRHDLSVARSVTFSGSGAITRSDIEAAQWVEDRWAPRDGVLITLGIRADWDRVVRDLLWSPRAAVAWMPGRKADLKIAAGFGIFRDSLPLGLLAQSQDQTSLSYFYLPDGTPAREPLETEFRLYAGGLRVPRYQNLSLSVERRLPGGFQGKLAYTRRVGRDGLTFSSLSGAPPGSGPGAGTYLLRNSRNDRYDALEAVVRRTFAGQFEWLAGYTRSSTRSDAVVDYSLENPIFARQAPGPFAWDTPHRVMTWGWVPFPRRLTPPGLERLFRELSVSYLVEYRTGFPFSIVNEEGFLVEAPNSRRLPAYFNANLHFEKKFRFFHYLWAWRFGLNNLTNNGNPNAVDNNVDSPAFLAYGRGQHRAFSVRLRFLGKR